jgi:hypothetical protein
LGLNWPKLTLNLVPGYPLEEFHQVRARVETLMGLPRLHQKVVEVLSEVELRKDRQKSNDGLHMFLLVNLLKEAY